MSSESKCGRLADWEDFNPYDFMIEALLVWRDESETPYCLFNNTTPWLDKQEDAYWAQF